MPTGCIFVLAAVEFRGLHELDKRLAIQPYDEYNGKPSMYNLGGVNTSRRRRQTPLLKKTGLRWISHCATETSNLFQEPSQSCREYL